MDVRLRFVCRTFSSRPWFTMAASGLRSTASRVYDGSGMRQEFARWLLDLCRNKQLFEHGEGHNYVHELDSCLDLKPGKIRQRKPYVRPAGISGAYFQPRPPKNPSLGLEHP